MAANIKLLIRVRVAPSEIDALMQVMRDFNVAHPYCYFDFSADVPKITERQAIDMVRTNPELSFAEIYETRTDKLDKLKHVWGVIGGVILLAIIARYGWFDTWREFTVFAMICAGWGVLWLAHELGRRTAVRDITETKGEREARQWRKY